MITTEYANSHEVFCALPFIFYPPFRCQGIMCLVLATGLKMKIVSGTSKEV